MAAQMRAAWMREQAAAHGEDEDELATPRRIACVLVEAPMLVSVLAD